MVDLGTIEVFPKPIAIPRGDGYGIKTYGTSDPLGDNTWGYEDLVGAVRPKTTGAGAPDLKIISGNLRGFAYSNADDLDGEFHFRHWYKQGTDIWGHYHWLHTGTAISGTINTMYYLSYAKGYNVAAFPDEVAIPIITPTANIATFPRYQHFIEEVQMSASGGLINPSGVITVSITGGAAILTSSAGLFNAGDVGRTIRVIGAGVAGGNLDTTIQAFTSTTQVTLAATASTTVTTQNAYRYRVLDSDNFEVDGIILMHFEMVTIPTITGATTPASANEPFIIFVDIHTGTRYGGTYNKNTPFHS